LLKLHQGLQVAQLLFNGARVGGAEVEVGQKNAGLNCPGARAA
jgi:hypothetical protein